MKSADITHCKAENLVDLKSVIIDKTLPLPDRMRSFFAQVNNPYLFKVDDIAVKVEFSSGKRLEEALLAVLLAERGR